MLPSRLHAFILTLTLFGASVSALAMPGELTAVIRHCGPPGAESKEVSPVTNQLERTLIYNKTLYLHFQPGSGGWSFTTAWNNHLPMTRAALEARLPCFRTAMQEAAAKTPAATEVDPTIASQTINRPANEATFGIPHMWLIVALVVTLLIFLIVPSARQRKLQREAREPVEHVYRKPNLEEYTSATPPPPPVRRDID